MTLTAVAPGVHAWLQLPSGLGRANAGVVVDEDGVTLVDTLMVASQWEPFGEAVDELGRPIRRVVLTSSHIEFVGGTPRFWQAAMYGSAQTSAHLDQPANVEVLRRLFPDHAAELPDDLATRRVSHVVQEAAQLTPAVQAIPVGGQMEENLVALVPGADVLLAGAMCAFGVTPLVFQGDPGLWADTLDELADLASVIVPGHGPVGGVEEVRDLQGYLRACVEADGHPEAIPDGPWDTWPGRELDPVNVERAAMLARGDTGVPPSLLQRVGLA